MKAEFTGGKWNYRHSEKNDQWVITGELGRKYKIARFPYEYQITEDTDIEALNEQLQREQEANARLCSLAPRLFRVLVEDAYLEGKVWQYELIAEVLGVKKVSIQDIDQLYNQQTKG